MPSKKHGGIMFNGMGDSAWGVMKTALPWKEKRSAGMPHADFKYVLNPILWITITGARWNLLHLLSNLWHKFSGIRPY
jgi:hypothetical protein